MGHIDMRTKASTDTKSAQKQKKEETCTLNSNIKECKNARQVGSIIIHSVNEQS